MANNSKNHDGILKQLEVLEKIGEYFVYYSYNENYYDKDPGRIIHGAYTELSKYCEYEMKYNTEFPATNNILKGIVVKGYNKMISDLKPEKQ